MQHYFCEIQGWFSSESFYREMVRRCPDGGTMVEVGVWKGRSLCCLLVEAKNSGKIIHILGIDHWQGSKDEPDLLNEAKTTNIHAICHANIKRGDYTTQDGFPLCRLRTVGSPTAAGLSDDQSIDFVFIDGSHDYDSVAADIAAWLPKIKPGGIIGGHDAGYASVAKAYGEAFHEVEIIEGCWWHIVEAAEFVHALNQAAASQPARQIAD